MYWCWKIIATCLTKRPVYEFRGIFLLTSKSIRVYLNLYIIQQNSKNNEPFDLIFRTVVLSLSIVDKVLL